MKLETRLPPLFRDKNCPDTSRRRGREGGIQESLTKPSIYIRRPNTTSHPLHISSTFANYSDNQKGTEVISLSKKYKLLSPATSIIERERRRSEPCL